MEIKNGDKFKLGNHFLINGDCSDPEIIKKLFGSHKAKTIICDVPYGVSISQAKRTFTKDGISHKDIINDQIQSDEEYQKFTKNWLETIKPYLYSKNAAYIFNSDKMVFALRDGMLDANFKFAQLLIWIKTHAVIGRMDYLPQHELIAYGWFGTHEFMKSKDKSVLIYPKPNKSKLHPTMKPVGLIRNLILNSSRIGDIIYDGFLGSGTCIIAAEQTKRRCFGVELDPEYCQTIINRFEKTFGVKAEKVE